MLYSIALALQISAGILLVGWSFRRYRQNVLEQYFNGNSSATRDEDNIVVLDKIRLRKSSRTVLLNMVSFADLTAGYLLSVFAERTYSNNKTFMLIIAFVTSIICLELLIIHIFVSMKYAHDERINFSELEARGLNVDTNITNREIDEMMDLAGFTHKQDTEK